MAACACMVKGAVTAMFGHLKTSVLSGSACKQSVAASLDCIHMEGCTGTFGLNFADSWVKSGVRRQQSGCCLVLQVRLAHVPAGLHASHLHPLNMATACCTHVSAA